MARSSRPRRAYRPPADAYVLILNRGGGAELVNLDEGDAEVWVSKDDPDFMERFPDFLHQSDLVDILQYLEDEGILTKAEADECEIEEEFYTSDDLSGVLQR